MLDTAFGSESSEGESRLRPTLQGKVKVVPSLPDYPQSHSTNYTRPAPITAEREVLTNLKHEWKRLSDSTPTSQIPRPRREVIIADLHNFEVYRCPVNDQKRPFELTSLHLFDVKAKNLCFDGHIQLGNVRHYVERISIEDLSIEGYGQMNSPKIIAYVQTRLASTNTMQDVWIRLRNPAPRYDRFHTQFLWVAVLGKHAIDYMDGQPAASVGLDNFKTDFNYWLAQRYKSSRRFLEWHAAFRNTSDFRVALNAHVDYIYNQAVNLSTSTHLTSHPIWAHCKADRRLAVEVQPKVVKDTLTTPHVFECFKDMYFAGKLKKVSPSKAVKRLQEKRMQSLGFADDVPLTLSRSFTNQDTRLSNVRKGDVVSIIPDELDKTSWQKSGDEWLAYVQGIQPLINGMQQLLVLWLYRPADTNMCLANYPIANEIFLSDNCNCREREILSTDIARIHNVEWSPKNLNTTKDFIIRQTYITQDSAFVTVNADHKTCACRRPQAKSIKWQAGDTVYLTKTMDGQKLLEPVAIHEIDHESKQAKVRILLRLQRDCSKLASEAKRTKVAPNELVLTDKLKTFSVSQIKRSCHVRFVSQSDVVDGRIPTPYDKQGAGDFWFISMGLETSTSYVQRLVFLNGLPKGFREAQEVSLPRARLTGLSLFSGGGGLDRGLEEGGAVEFQTSVDYDPAAIHTQRANCRDPSNMRLFCGSVDDYLQALLSGSKVGVVARIGEVEMVAAGSPCPGFSALQQNMLSQQSLTYASHITTFCTAVDVYRPLYGMLENVVNMASTRKGFEEQNVLSQLVACLVSMGYQVNQYIMDSWTYGSCQRRSRIILTIAAPGLEPTLQRPHTHSRSYEETAARSLGRLPNGERFGDREHYPTPFPIVSAKEAMFDLPNIGNGNVQTCIPFPDHRLSRPTNRKSRALLECIPRQPAGYGYAEAMQLNLVPPPLQLRKKEMGKAYRRIKADGLIPTITTDVNMQDARNGASVHWSEHRPLSIQNARRAQGYPDHEPIIGTLNEQWRIVGNGVDRKVSFTLGLALRDALTKSKSISELNGDSDDEVELLVDVEERLDGHSGDKSTDPVIDVLREVSPPSTASSSTDSFSSTHETRQQFDLAMSLDGSRDTGTTPISPGLVPQRLVEFEQRLAPAGGFFSCMSPEVSADSGRLSLPATQSSLVAKRQRDGDGEKQELKPTESHAGLFKRAKFAEVQKTDHTFQ